jgi:hypothetical protein
VIPKLPSFDRLVKGEDDYQEVFDAATAIALHDPGIWRPLLQHFVVRNQGKGRFSLLKTPEGASRRTAELAWTLAYVDCVQEWGRNVETADGWDGDVGTASDIVWTPRSVNLKGGELRIRYDAELSDVLNTFDNQIREDVGRVLVHVTRELLEEFARAVQEKKGAIDQGS